MRRASFWLIAPYATWMALMTALPATAACYAIRTVVVAALLAAGWARKSDESDKRDESDLSDDCRFGLLSRFCPLIFALAIGLAVFLVWILPEQFDWAWYRDWCIVGEGGTKAVAEASGALIALRLVGSAFVIPVAEELFFRKWLIGFAGFAWMVALFAVEHDRWLVGAIAGAIYGALYLRRGLLAAIVAHATTNLVLGLWVLRTNQWQFW